MILSLIEFSFFTLANIVPCIDSIKINKSNYFLSLCKNFYTYTHISCICIFWHIKMKWLARRPVKYLRHHNKRSLELVDILFVCNQYLYLDDRLFEVRELWNCFLSLGFSCTWHSGLNIDRFSTIVSWLKLLRLFSKQDSYVKIRDGTC